MKQFTEEQKLYVFHSLEPRAEAIMEMVRDNPEIRWDNHIKELELIKTIFEDMVDDAPAPPRSIEDIYAELQSHPDFVSGDYYSKQDVLGQIASYIEEDYDDDEQLNAAAAEIYNNNTTQIHKNIWNAFTYAFHHDNHMLDKCNLSLSKKNSYETK